MKCGITMPYIATAHKNPLTFFLLVCYFTSINPIPAYAYLDPGTGTLILQSIIGGLAAAGAFASLYFQKLKTFFSKKNPDSESIEKK